MKLHKLKFNTTINANISDVWAFFINPNNLEVLTPNNMQFKITCDADNTMYAGKIISYVITPLANIPMTWVTEITQCKELDYFIDEQRFGPYKFWHHVHQFIEDDGKTKMTDELTYSFYGGAIGDLIQNKIITKKIEGIFNYRSIKINEYFHAS